MFILKNAVRNIYRNKIRNILIGIIVIVIAASCCVALSIKTAAQAASDEGIDSMEITGTISLDRDAIIDSLDGDLSSMRSIMSSYSDLSLEELSVYAEFDSVKDFYYTIESTVNGTTSFEPYTDSDSDSSSDTDESNANDTLPNDSIKTPQGSSGMGEQGDFTLTGFSEEMAMTAFVDGSNSIVEGAIFTFDEADYNCIITNYLAAYNDVTIGDTIEIENPNNEDETYTFNIVGIYSTTESSSSSMSFSTSDDPLNYIYVNYLTLNDIDEQSTAAAVVGTDDSDNETTTALRTSTSGEYTFSSVSDIETFQEELTASGLSEYYSISSSDITSYEESLVPLENLSSFSMTFLWIIICIGAVILIILNVFNIRERTYEIGVLTAIGMNKKKVAMQFLCELFIVTLIAIVIGTGIGAAVSSPIADTLLEDQIESMQVEADTQTQNFGREITSHSSSSISSSSDTEYLSDISATVNFTVILELLAIGIGLTIISGSVALVFIMRYEPLKILSDRK
jgi:putative ABC transport system permease protein